MNIEFEKCLAEIINLRKYRNLAIPEATVYDLLEQEWGKHRNPKDTVKSVRKKLHNIVAPYLGDPDYDRATEWLNLAYKTGGVDQEMDVCTRILEFHASTRERLPIAHEFFRQLFTFTGKPNSIIDVACGLNAFFPWMDLPISTQYYSFDIHSPRVNLINHYFLLKGLAPLAEIQDVLVNPPVVEADVAFFFKEAHRFEQRRKGVNLPLWQTLKVNYLLVSLPSRSLSGNNDLRDKQRKLIYDIVKGESWEIIEAEFGEEMIFCIKRDTGNGHENICILGEECEE